MADFKVLGHRGTIDATASFHQNSYAAFSEALATADGFETDAIGTRDGHIFLAHETKYVNPAHGVEYVLAEHLDAASATHLGQRRLNEVDGTEAAALRLKDGSPLPSLPQTLELVKKHRGKILNIELKGHNVLGPVLRDIRASGIPTEQIMLSSFNHPSLVELRRLAPEFQTTALFVSTTTPSAPIFPWYPGSAGRYTIFTAENLASPIVREIKPDNIMIPDTELSPEAVELVKRYVPEAGLMAWVFTEIGGLPLEKLFSLTATLPLAALLIDKPRAYAEKFRALAATRGIPLSSSPKSQT